MNPAGDTDDSNPGQNIRYFKRNMHLHISGDYKLVIVNINIILNRKVGQFSLEKTSFTDSKVILVLVGW